MGIKPSVDIGGLILGCWDRSSRRATCVWQLENNLRELEKQREELMAKRNDVMRRVSHEEERYLVKLDEVEVWQGHVDARIAEADKLLSMGRQEIQRICLGGCCSMNCISSLRFGSQVIDEVDYLAGLLRRDFESVALRPVSVAHAQIPGDQPVGLEAAFNQVWRWLFEEQVGMVGLSGMGGVGKTTLVKKIYHRFSATRRDLELIWVVVSREFSLERIQEEIGERLGLCHDGQWAKGRVDRKALSVFNTLLGKRFVLILDDLWEAIDLDKVGIPRPKSQSESKIIFTTRSEDVCGHMGAKKILKMVPLACEEAWQLFEHNIDEQILEIPGVFDIAQQIAMECGGLPLAVITVSRSMARKKMPQEWTYALQVLKHSASSLEGMEEKVLHLLKFSYDSLDDEAKSQFLYCSLFAEDFLIEKEELICHFICEDLIKREDGGIDLPKKGYNAIGYLIRACLLEEEGECVKMHDVIRDMALWIGRNQEVERFFVKTGAQLTKVPNLGESKRLKRMSLVGNKLEVIDEVPVCPNLSTLFLSHNPLIFIHDDIFQFMNVLTTLDLSHSRITYLPMGVTKLAMLKYINLSETAIKELPIELNKLEKLKYLNIEWMKFLVTIPGKLLSGFKMLAFLKMRSYMYFSARQKEERKLLLEELQLLAHLSALSVTVCEDAELKQLPSCIEDLDLRDFRSASSIDVSLFTEMKNLTITDAHSLRDINVDSMIGREAQTSGSLFSSTIIIQCSFNSLQTATFTACDRLQHCTWLILAPNLRYLRVSICRDIIEIISAEKLQEITKGDGSNPNLFDKLEALELVSAPHLRSIYAEALPFPFLKKIEVLNCCRLTRLPLNSNSAKDSKIAIKGDKLWWEGIEWEDEVTKSAFLHRFLPV